MALADIGADIAHRVGVFEDFLLIGVDCLGRPPCAVAFADTVGRAIAEYVNDTACSHVVATCALVTSVRHLGVVLQGEVGKEFGLKFGEDVCTAHACVHDYTFVVRLSYRDVVAGLVVSAADRHVCGI